jgi:hypothetical protein
LAISAIRSQRFDIRVLVDDIYGFNAITEIAINHGGVAVAAGLLRGQEEVRVAASLLANIDHVPDIICPPPQRFFP